MFSTLFAELRSPWAQISTLFIAGIVYIISVTAQNWPTLVSLGRIAGFSESFKLGWILLGSIRTNFTVFSAITTVLLAILFGVTITLTIHLLRRAKTIQSNTSTLLGSVAGIFGIGCAACGGALLTAFLSIFGATSLITLLPLHGQEFSLLAIGLLLYSIYTLTKKLNTGFVCNIDDTV